MVPESELQPMRVDTAPEDGPAEVENYIPAMKNRQLNVPDTPKGKRIDLKSMQAKIGQMLKKQEQDESKEQPQRPKIALSKIKIKRADSINFDQEEKVGDIKQKLPLRKNSARRLLQGQDNGLSPQLKEKLG